MTDRNERLKSIRERLSAATPGPWEHNAGNGISVPSTAEYINIAPTTVLCEFDLGPSGYADCEFVANAPSDIAYLLALVERYEKALEFYADLKNWRTVTVSNKNQRFCIMTGADLEYFQEPNQDSYCGKRARKALEAGERE